MLFRLAWRNIWRQRRRTLITLTSISLGLAFALFFVALGEGVYEQLIYDVARMQSGHITLEHQEYRDAPAIDLSIKVSANLRKKLAALPGVEKTKVLILGQGVARSGSGAIGVGVMGVEPSIEKTVSPIARRLVSGDYLEDTDTSKILVGRKLAKRLHLDIGKKIVLTTNHVEGSIVEDLFRVKGIFETGSDEVDGYLIQAPLEFVRKLYGLPEDGVTQVAILLDDRGKIPQLLEQIPHLTGDKQTAVLPWWEVMSSIASYIRLDKASNHIFQALLLFLILFTIFNTILMSVLERKQEFAVSLAVGTPPRFLQVQVLVESALIGLIGVGVGILLGGLASHAGRVYGIDLTGIFSGDDLDVSGFAISLVMRPFLTKEMIFEFGGFVFVAILLLSLFPMHRAARVPIADTLR